MAQIDPEEASQPGGQFLQHEISLSKQHPFRVYLGPPYDMLFKKGLRRPGCWRHSVCSAKTRNGAIQVTLPFLKKE